MALPPVMPCARCGTPSPAFQIGQWLALCPTDLGAYVSTPEGQALHGAFVAGARAWVARQHQGPRMVIAPDGAR